LNRAVNGRFTAGVITLALAALPTLALAALPTLALAQDTGGVAQTTNTGSVMKGKAPVASGVIKVRFPKPKTFTLKNGVRVYVLEDHRVPTERFNLLIHAGTLYEPKPGVAEMTAQMMTEGTQSRTYQQIAAQTEDIGANVRVAAGEDTTAVNAAGLTESEDTLIDLMADVLMHPSFPADRLDRVKFQATAAVRQRRSNAVAMAGELATKVFHGDTPYGRTQPTAAQIAGIGTDDLASFHAAYFRPDGAVLGVTGDVDIPKLKRKLEAAFENWKPAGSPHTPPAPTYQPRESTRIFLVDRPGSAQTVLQFGNISVKMSDPDYIPLVVANGVLGGGSSGRLFQNIREQKGYTYGAYSTLGASPWPGVWGASASVRTPVTEPAAREFFKEFNRLQDETVPEEEIERTKRSIIGGFARTLENPEAVLQRSLDLVEYGLPAGYWDTYPDRIQAVSAADIQRVARKYLGKDHIQLIAVGERKQIESGLQKLGQVEVVDPNQIATFGSAGGGSR
jgi:predicted Zn-dependent peptidase